MLVIGLKAILFLKPVVGRDLELLKQRSVPTVVACFGGKTSTYNG